MSTGYRYKAGDPWRVVPFMFLGAILQAGLAIGVSAADSLFIANIGANHLPVIYALMPILMILYITISTRVLNRWGIDVLFTVTILLLVCGGFTFGYLLRGSSPPDSIYYAAMFYGSLWCPESPVKVRPMTNPPIGACAILSSNSAVPATLPSSLW